MTARTRSLVVVVALAGLANRASAHEVDCSKLASIAISDPNGGGPLLDPSGLPSLAAPLATALTVNRYPALVAFDVTIRNLATEPSVLSSVSDTLPQDPTRIRFFGDALAGTIPVGGTLHRVYTVAVSSVADCLAAFPVAPIPHAPVCERTREDEVVVTTETDIAVCRAHVVCEPPIERPPCTCAAPTWAPVIAIPPPAAVTVGHSLAVGCDGFTWASATSSVLGAPQELPGALFRFDPAGLLTATLRGDDQITEIAPDTAGDLVAVVASGAGALLGEPPPSAPLSVRKYDANLNASWDAPLPGTPPDLGAALAVDASSNVLVGYLRVNAQQQAHFAVRKLSPDGAPVWDVELARSTSATIHLARDGGVFVAGVATDVASQLPPFATPEAVYLARLDPAGNLLSTRLLPAPDRTVLSQVTVDPTGRVAATGLTDSPIDGGPPLASPQAFVAAWDASGTLRWLRVLRPTPLAGIPAAAATTDASHAVIDPSGAIWIAGDVNSGTLDLAQPSSTTAVPFVARFDTAGTMRWVRQFPLGDSVGASPVDLVLDGGGSGVAMIAIHVSLNTRATWLERIAPDGT
jgi:hypothetical protein